MLVFFFYLYLMIGVIYFLYDSRNSKFLSESGEDPSIKLVAYLIVGTGYMFTWPIAFGYDLYLTFKNRSKS